MGVGAQGDDTVVARVLGGDEGGDVAGNGGRQLVGVFEPEGLGDLGEKVRLIDQLVFHDDRGDGDAGGAMLLLELGEGLFVEQVVLSTELENGLGVGFEHG